MHNFTIKKLLRYATLSSSSSSSSTSSFTECNTHTHAHASLVYIESAPSLLCTKIAAPGINYTYSKQQIFSFSFLHVSEFQNGKEERKRATCICDIAATWCSVVHRISLVELYTHCTRI